MTERELLVDSLRRLNDLAVGYMLTGSMASNYWGIPRTTHDLDFVIQFQPTDATRIAAAFAGDYFIQESSIRAAMQPPYQFNAIDSRSALKIDFWYLQDTPMERAMFARRIERQVFGERAWLSTPEDMILHKLYWNRLGPSARQLFDAAGIVQVQGSSLDVSYMTDWGQRIGVASELADLLSGKILPKST